MSIVQEWNSLVKVKTFLIFYLSSFSYWQFHFFIVSTLSGALSRKQVRVHSRYIRTYTVPTLWYEYIFQMFPTQLTMTWATLVNTSIIEHGSAKLIVGISKNKNQNQKSTFFMEREVGCLTASTGCWGTIIAGWVNCGLQYLESPGLGILVTSTNYTKTKTKTIRHNCNLIPYERHSKAYINRSPKENQ